MLSEQLARYGNRGPPLGKAVYYGGWDVIVVVLPVAVMTGSTVARP